MEFKTYHITRHLSKHAYELDDELYGAPVPKQERDWTLDDPEKYITLLENEKKVLSRGLEDMIYILRVNNVDLTYTMKKYNKSDADAHSYHDFIRRSFTYVEKISHLLQSMAPDLIELDIPKAKRQVHVLIAALNDIECSIVRFKDYARNK